MNIKQMILRYIDSFVVTPFEQPSLSEATLTNDEWKQAFRLVMECSFVHKLSRHTELYASSDQLIVYDTQCNKRDESMFVGQRMVQLYDPAQAVQVSVSEAIKDCLPSLPELYEKLFGEKVELPCPRPTYLCRELYTLSPSKLFRLFKKVVGSGNNSLESEVMTSNDVELLKLLDVTYANREDNDSTDEHRLTTRLTQVQRALDLSKVGQLLDFGGGCGDFVAALKNMCRQGCEAHCLDIKRWITKEHTLKHRSVKYSFVDTWRLPYEDNKFDLVTVLQVIHHLDHPLQTLRELHRVLKPGGYLFVREHDCQSYEDQLCIDLEHFVYEVRFRGNERMCSTYEAKYYSRRHLAEMLHEVGFRKHSDDTNATITQCYNSLWYK